MDISFTNYPVANRNPGVFTEIDPSDANTGAANQRTLILAQVLLDGDGVTGAPVLCESVNHARRIGGGGSMLHLMVDRYRRRDTFGEVWLLPLDENVASAQATGGFYFGGSPSITRAGTLSLYVGDVRVQVPVQAGATLAQIASVTVGSIGVQADLPVTAALDNTGYGVIITARGAGAYGNEIPLGINLLGVAGGEQTPDGLDVLILPMTGGTANPDLNGALAGLNDEPFDFVVTPYTDTASLDALRAFMNDQTGRWAPLRMVYGHAFTAYRGSLGQAAALGAVRNDQHMSTLPISSSSTATWLAAADFGASCAQSLRADPALPLQRVATGIAAPAVEDRFGFGERNTLLYDGMSTFEVDDDGTVRLSRVVTMYRENTSGVPDDSYLDVETMYQLMAFVRFMRARLTSVFARKKLVSDGTRIAQGNNIVTPRIIRNFIIAQYRELERQGVVQNGDEFAKNLVVINAGRGLIKALEPADLAQQLRQIAQLVRFKKS